MVLRRIERKRWNRIQQGERTYHERKDPEKILEIGLRYWKKILNVLPEEVRLSGSTRALDLGCGGCGILLALPGGRHVGVDPLMDFYLEKFPFLRERKNITWVSSTAEEFATEKPFDIVFLINALDHTFSPGLVLKQAMAAVVTGGHLIILLNCHNTRFFRWYYAALYRFIDRHHPFHFAPRDVIDRLEGFHTSMVKEIDALWLSEKQIYDEDVLGKKRFDALRLLKKVLNPFKYPMAVSRFVFRRPVKKRKPTDKSIISIYLLVFRKAH